LTDERTERHNEARTDGSYGHIFYQRCDVRVFIFELSFLADASTNEIWKCRPEPRRTR